MFSPFSDFLRIGFTARYAGGEIRVEGKEILGPRCFTADQQPNIPGRISIARQLINWFVEIIVSFLPGSGII